MRDREGGIFQMDEQEIFFLEVMSELTPHWVEESKFQAEEASSAKALRQGWKWTIVAGQEV